MEILSISLVILMVVIPIIVIILIIDKYNVLDDGVQVDDYSTPDKDEVHRQDLYYDEDEESED
jgi:hypothetical protein